MIHLPSRSNRLVWLAAATVAAAGLRPAALLATNIFAMPAGQTSLVFSPVGDAGNAADTNGTNRGAVPYNYAIGTYDVTSAQYAAFLNAVANVTDTYALYNPKMANPGSAGITNVGCGIIQTPIAGGFSYSVVSGKANFPVNWVSFGDAARFTNWLDNGQPTGPEGNGTTETGAYTLNGATTAMGLGPAAVPRVTGATYVLPTEDEWYKAAYYKGGSINAGYWKWATQSDNPPQPFVAPPGIAEPPGGANEAFVSGSPPQTTYVDPTNYLTPVGAYLLSLGPYGTFDMQGDVAQWTEGEPTFVQSRGSGGDNFSDSWGVFNSLGISDAGDPTGEGSGGGIRVVELPESASLSLFVFGVSGLLMRRVRAR